jgi:predicted enzyme related to lactoylglutathione lyase
MITGIHALLYSKDPDTTRSFFRDVLGLPSVDAGRGWLIFALPPAELGIHPTEEEEGPELYLMCQDVERTVAELRAKGVELTRPISDEGWGRLTAIRIPGGIELGLYEPRHPTALTLAIEAATKQRGGTA